MYIIKRTKYYSKLHVKLKHFSIIIYDKIIWLILKYFIFNTYKQVKSVCYSNPLSYRNRTRCSWNAQRSEDTPRFVEACCFMNTAIKLPCCLSFSVLVNSGDLEWWSKLPYRNQKRTGSRLHRQTDGQGETNIPPNKHDISSPYEVPTYLNRNTFNQY